LYLDLQKLGREDQLPVNHLFSAEIVAWKQHYIQANFDPLVIFRDILNLLLEKDAAGNFIA
jgi:hypothetical protein